MSHTHKDQPGGHAMTFLETNGGDCWNTMKARRFGKKFHARMEIYDPYEYYEWDY